MIDVPPSDFYRLYGGLVRMLQAIEKAGPAGLSSNVAGIQIFNSRAYGWKVLTRAEKMGYITREQAPKPRGGYPYTINKLTDKGRKLLQELGPL